MNSLRREPARPRSALRLPRYARLGLAVAVTVLGGCDRGFATAGEPPLVFDAGGAAKSTKAVPVGSEEPRPDPPIRPSGTSVAPFDPGTVPSR